MKAWQNIEFLMTLDIPVLLIIRLFRQSVVLNYLFWQILPIYPSIDKCLLLSNLWGFSKLAAFKQ
ncbi:hypothetical protein THIOM_002200 [Candidatus Thiomargarita nelsonii]|uniref:Uncharacterized protein n=1 Tax=Candidatus Thiomargarita nelsonii TaxID=1003181 RepID=A0A176S254_9GAMM|nr:hypothetical protein THIOM_002200 [Candidatus Thiomargarita nelsonii]